MENTYLIVGLGNPGAEYVWTRHNIGFMAVERLAERVRAHWIPEERFQARFGRGNFEGRKLLLCQPQTYMNASGMAVRLLADYYKIPVNRLVVLVDDADLPFGEIRLRPRGSAGGHHGLESVEQHLGSRGYARLRIGIGRQPDGRREIVDYVLGKFLADERKQLGMILDRVTAQIECWLDAGIQRAMNLNGDTNAPPQRIVK